MIWNQMGLLLPIGVVLGAALVVVFLDLVLSKHERYILPWVALSGTVLGFISVLQTQSIMPDIWFNSYLPTAQHPVILGGAFCVDRFGSMIWILACLSGGLAILASPPESEESALSTGEYFGLILLAVAGMMLLSVSHDWLTLLLSLEIMSIATYILTSSNRDDLRSNEAGLKYLVLGAFSTALLLMGIAFYYGAFGSLSLSRDMVLWNFLSTDEQRARTSFLMLAMGLLMVGTLFKVGAAPFHFWIPDVYQGAPTAITGFMAVGVKAAAFAVVARLVFETFGDRTLIFRQSSMQLLLIISVATMIIGNVLAISQTNLKRMLAYSGIAHTGYLLLAFLIVPDAKTDGAAIDEHLKSVVFYLLVYGVMTLGAFGVIALSRKDGKPMEELSDFAGLAREHPGIALCMAIFMLSLAGMPPMGGFFAKFMIFRGALEQNNRGINIGAVIGITTSAISLYYYLRVIVVMYMSPSNATAADESTKPAQCNEVWSSTLLIYAAGIATLVMGLMPGWFY